MTGQRQQSDILSRDEHSFLFENNVSFKGNADHRPTENEREELEAKCSAAQEIAGENGRGGSEREPDRAYFNRAEKIPAFLVLKEGLESRPSLRRSRGEMPIGPCLIRSSEWLLTPELAVLYEQWLICEDEEQAERVQRRIYYRLRAESMTMLESSDGEWAAVALPYSAELAALPHKYTVLQDTLLEALFAAVASRQAQGCDDRLDLLAAYPASAAEFAAQREFIEAVAEQTLGYGYAAACRIGALIAPGIRQAAAAEIARTADFLVLDGAAAEPAPEEAAALCFTLAAGDITAAVRSVKPAAVILAAGAPAAAALADLYRIGLSGIFCSAAQRTEALLRAACLTWMARQDTTGTAAGGRP